MRLGIEAVNRYESNVVNTLDDARWIVEQVGSDALFVHMDTFHMNIEEHDCADAIARNIDAIGHVHIGESHRGYLGSGSVDFPTYFRALAANAYDGPIVLRGLFAGGTQTTTWPMRSAGLAQPLDVFGGISRTAKLLEFMRVQMASRHRHPWPPALPLRRVTAD